MRSPIVNEKDEIIGYKERANITADDIMRVSGVWILNNAGEVLVAQRAANKKYDPLKWAVSAAGSVDEGETYAQNIVKEVQEELGITVLEQDLIRGERQLVRSNHMFFYQSYFVRCDVTLADINVQATEVESVRWISVSELVAWFAEKPGDFIPSFAISMRDLEAFVESQSTT